VVTFEKVHRASSALSRYFRTKIPGKRENKRLVHSSHKSVPARERYCYEITHTLLQEVLAGKSVRKNVMTSYWFDEGSGKVFCLVQAPNKEAAATVHREAHGLEADEIIQVQEGV
jgi:hypothetical protein